MFGCRALPVRRPNALVNLIHALYKQYPSKSIITAIHEEIIIPQLNTVIRMLSTESCLLYHHHAMIAE